MSATRNTVSLTDEAAGWVSEWRKLGEHRQLWLITACVLACGENSVVIHLLRSLRAAEPEAKCMGMIPGTAFMCGEMAGYYCPNCRREDDR